MLRLQYLSHSISQSSGTIFLCSKTQIPSFYSFILFPMKKLELLFPAGNLEKLKYAIAYGADAVYA